MTKYSNCSRCGKFLEANEFGNLCIECVEKDEADFRRIKEYILEHPRAKIFNVSLDLNISISKIRRYLREGRLEIIEKNNLFLRCEMCGKPICSGSYCDECFKQANHDYKAVYVGKAPAKPAKMVKFVPLSGNW
jgi:predicted amidophosphoribosyltransferase